MRTILNNDSRKYLERTKHYEGPLGPWFEHLIEDENLSLGEARDVLLGWQAIPYVDPTRGHMATLIKRNKEVHFAIFRKHRRRAQVTSNRIISFLQPILDKEVFLVTKLAPDEDDRFIKHLGFEELGATMGGVRTFILNSIRYPGVKS